MSSTTVDKIKERLDILDVVGQYLELKKAGSTYKARCPFHNEKTPSFTVSPDRGTFYCFGCHAKGDIFSFVEQIEGLDFKGALKMLAERAGVPLEREDPKQRDENERLYSILEAAKAEFVGNLEFALEVKEYLGKRGIKDETVKEWAVGYAKDEWRSLYENLKRLKFSDDEILRAGLAKQTENKSGERLYDAFRGRVMFPIFDPSGRVVGFSGRTLSKDLTIPKYVNSPETMLFNKSELLYGLHIAKSAIRKKNYSILVEGQMDLIMSHQAGYANTVAGSGTALTRQHLERLKKLSPRIIMAYDSDAAGLAAAEKNARLALQLGLEVKIAKLPKGSDPADILLTDPKQFADALRSSKHIVDFELGELVGSGLDKRMIATDLRRKVLPFISDLQSTIERSHYVAEAAKRTGIREEAIWEDIKNPMKISTPSVQSPTKQNGKAFSLERRIMGILYWKPEQEEFRTKVLEICGEERFAKFQEGTGENKDALIFETEEYYDNLTASGSVQAGKDPFDQDMRELLRSLAKKVLQEEVDEAQMKLREVENDEDARKFMEKIQEKTMLLEKLKQG